MSDKIQFACLGFGLCLFLVAVIPATEEAQPRLQTTEIDLWSVENPREPETSSEVVSERGEVIQEVTQRDTVQPKSLPLDPQQAEPALSAAIAVVPSSPAVFSMSGTRYDLKSFVDSHYRRPWTYPGGIDAHLAEHGVDTSSIQGLSHTEKERLHAAIHERELKITPIGGKPVVKQSLITPAYSSCPGGVCPAPTYTTRRRGLFGLRR